MLSADASRRFAYYQAKRELDSLERCASDSFHGANYFPETAHIEIESVKQLLPMIANLRTFFGDE